MNLSAATYYFWFFSYPQPLAEVGVRSV
jgi:hypothetical protein